MPFTAEDIRRVGRPEWARDFAVDVKIDPNVHRDILTARASLESSVHSAVVEYLTDSDLCFDDDMFPSTRELTGEYYLGDEWYVHHSGVDAFHCSVMARCLGTSHGSPPIDDHLGLEVHLRWLPDSQSFESWRNTTRP